MYCVYCVLFLTEISQSDLGKKKTPPAGQRESSEEADINRKCLRV